MNSNDYGVKNFDHKVSFKNIVVFSNQEKKQTFDEQLPLSENRYINVVQIEGSESWKVNFYDALSGEYGDLYLEQNPDAKVGHISKFIYDEAIIDSPDFLISNGADYYNIDGKFYIILDGVIELDEVIITAQGKPFEGSRTQNRIAKKLEDANVFVTVFISSDGAQLERAYLNINQLMDREVVLFIETDDSSNIFGSVFRVKSGDAIDSTTFLPTRKMARIAKTFGNSVDTGYISQIIKKHLKDKGTENENTFFLILNRGLLHLGTRLVEIAADFTLAPLGNFFEYVSIEINDNLRLSDDRWQASIDGKPNPKYNPILPGHKLITESFSPKELAKTIDETFFKPFTPKIKDIVTKLKSVKPLDKLLGNRLNGVEKFIDRIPKYLTTLLKLIQSVLKGAFEFYNGLLVGIINSLVDLLKTVFDILALICKGLHALLKEGIKFVNSPGAYMGMIIEGLENGIEMITNAITIDNLKAFMGFQFFIIKKVGELGITAIQSLQNLSLSDVKDAASEATDISIPFDSIGYYTGYIIGFIAQEVLIFMATAGVGTVAEGIRGAVRSYVELGKAIGRVSSKIAKGVHRKITLSVEFFLKIMRSVKSFAKNIPKHFETLKLWINDLLATLKAKTILIGNVTYSFVDPITILGKTFFNILRRNLWGKISKLGVGMAKSENGLYAFTYKGVNLAQDLSKTQAEEFLKNLFSKIKKEPDVKIQKYLDELAALIPRLEGGFWGATNKFGTELKWLKQAKEEMLTKIDDFISKGKPAYKKLDDVGGEWNAVNKNQQDLLSNSLEAEVAQEFLKHDELTNFGNNVFGKNSKGDFKEILGDIDVGTSKYHVEVKFNVSGTTKSSKFKAQFKKYLDETTQKYINVEGKPVVLFVKQFTNGGSVNQSVLKTLKDQGVIIITELNQIKNLY